MCGRCHYIKYCSRECQQKDWPIHKIFCKSYSAFITSDRPSKDHIVAILFPVDKKKPEFIWLPFKGKYDDEDGIYWESPKLEPIFGDGSKRYTHIRRNRFLGKELSDTVVLTFLDTFLIDGSLPNLSIASLPGSPTVYWRGPVVAYAMKGLEIDPRFCKDLDLVDSRSAVDELLFYANLVLKDIDQRTRERENVMGVKINCHGDQKTFGAKPFEAIEIPRVHPIFDHNEESEIAERIGLPILTRKYPPNQAWADEKNWKESLGPYCNQPATFLHLSCDKKSSTWGWAPPQWQNRVGSVLVVRKDRKPLLPLHMEAISRYCQFEIAPFFEHSQGGYAPEEPMGKDAVLAAISRASFIIFWYKVLKESKEMVESPYDS